MTPRTGVPCGVAQPDNERHRGATWRTSAKAPGAPADDGSSRVGENSRQGEAVLPLDGAARTVELVDPLTKPFAGPVQPHAQVEPGAILAALGL